MIPSFPSGYPSIPMPSSYPSSSPFPSNHLIFNPYPHHPYIFTTSTSSSPPHAHHSTSSPPPHPHYPTFSSPHLPPPTSLSSSFSSPPSSSPIHPYHLHHPLIFYILIIRILVKWLKCLVCSHRISPC